ncbi:MAG: phosphate ABC transporter substrate-binding protein [Verrucomicrobiota bacterium]
MLLRTLGLLALSLCLLSCGDSEEVVRLEATGSSTLAPLLSQIAKRYEALHPGVRIDIQTGGSSRGIADAASGVADIGMSSRALKESEKEGRLTHTVAMDGVALLVHAENPVSELSEDEIVGIYRGEITNWQEVGGKDAPITCVNRASGRSEWELFQAFLGMEAEEFRPDMISGENQHGIKTIAGDPHAIIYMSIGASLYEAARGVPIKLLPLRGVPATAEKVASGDFPLNRPLLLITSPEPAPPVQEFIKYALSPAVHDLVRQQSYVPVL